MSERIETDSDLFVSFGKSTDEVDTDVQSLSNAELI